LCQHVLGATIRPIMGISKQMKELSAGAAELGITFSQVQTTLFEEYMNKILAWNRRRNIVSKGDEERIGAYHLVDSVSASMLLPQHEKFSCLDVGSGAGFPGIPLKIVRPDMKLGLAEPKRWRYLFLESLIAELQLLDVSLFRARVEDLPTTLVPFDVILVRAVASLKRIVPVTLPRLKSGGILIAYKSGDVPRELKEADGEILASGGKLYRTESLTLPLTGVQRVLVTIQKL